MAQYNQDSTCQHGTVDHDIDGTGHCTACTDNWANADCTDCDDTHYGPDCGSTCPNCLKFGMVCISGVDVTADTETCLAPPPLPPSPPPPPSSSTMWQMMPPPPRGKKTQQKQPFAHCGTAAASVSITLMCMFTIQHWVHVCRRELNGNQF